MTPQQIRTHLQNLRYSLNETQQKQHAQAALSHFLPVLSAQSTTLDIAVFFSYNAELNTQPLIDYLLNHTAHRLYLPVVNFSEPGYMHFHRYTADTPLVANRWGIMEPTTEQEISASELDWVITPLVGFNRQGHRMGMGGGFYDRSFAFKLKGHARTQLIGWAHSCQEYDKLPKEPWDVSLDSLVTEKEYTAFSCDSD